MPSQPTVSIGMPVYNGAHHLAAALESLLAQTYHNFELIISDNASTDASPRICRDFAARDARIRYSRNETNIGAHDNFLRTVQLAAAPYFMWAAHDDLWAPEFIEETLRLLDGHDDVIGSMARVRFIDVNSPLWLRFWAPHGTAPLLGSVQQNVVAHLKNPGTNSRMYALFRRHILADCLDIPICWGADTAFVTKSLKYGKYQEVDRCLIWRRRGMSQNMRAFVRQHHRTRLGRIFPFWDCSRYILSLNHVPKSLPVFLALFKLNVLHTLWYFKSWLFDSRGSEST
jgi:glycosyltransferase involved in cell wall biosynthesis